MALTADERLIRVRVKIERAKQHLTYFDKLAEGFLDAYSEITVSDSTSKYSFFQGMPDIRKYPVASFELLATAGDVIQNLRSSLDHLVYQLAEVGNPDVTPSQIGFPIARNAEHYELTKVRKVKGVRPDAVNHIDSYKPYRGGNDALWRLHELSNIDKHKYIFTVGHNYLLIGNRFAGYYWLKTSNPDFPGVFQPKSDEDVEFAPDEAPSEAKVPEGEALVPFLHQIVDAIDALVVSFRSYLE